ncbi:hypothetical protein ABKV19_024358 [Rosa sericea]
MGFRGSQLSTLNSQLSTLKPTPKQRYRAKKSQLGDCRALKSMQQQLICYLGPRILGCSALLLNLRVNSWTVYNARNLELMGFTNPWFDAIGIASKLSYMDFGNAGLCQTWQTPRHLFTTAHNSEVTFRGPC